MKARIFGIPVVLILVGVVAYLFIKKLTGKSTVTPILAGGETVLLKRPAPANISVNGVREAGISTSVNTSTSWRKIAMKGTGGIW